MACEGKTPDTWLRSENCSHYLPPITFQCQECLGKASKVTEGKGAADEGVAVVVHVVTMV